MLARLTYKSGGRIAMSTTEARIAALSAWKTKLVFKKPQHGSEEAPLSKVKGRLCLRGERTWGETLD